MKLSFCTFGSTCLKFEVNQGGRSIKHLDNAVIYEVFKIPKEFTYIIQLIHAIHTHTKVTVIVIYQE